MNILESSIFSHLRYSDLKLLESILAELEGSKRVSMAFIEWLSIWKEDEWIDSEKIELNIWELHTLGLWKNQSFVDFVKIAKQSVSSSVTRLLEEMKVS